MWRKRRFHAQNRCVLGGKAESRSGFRQKAANIETVWDSKKYGGSLPRNRYIRIYCQAAGLWHFQPRYG